MEFWEWGAGNGVLGMGSWNEELGMGCLAACLELQHCSCALCPLHLLCFPCVYWLWPWEKPCWTALLFPELGLGPGKCAQGIWDLHLPDPASCPPFPFRRKVISCSLLPVNSRVSIAGFGSTEGAAIMLIRHFD